MSAVDVVDLSCTQLQDFRGIHIAISMLSIVQKRGHGSLCMKKPCPLANSGSIQYHIVSVIFMYCLNCSHRIPKCLVRWRLPYPQRCRNGMLNPAVWPIHIGIGGTTQRPLSGNSIWLENETNFMGIWTIINPTKIMGHFVGHFIGLSYIYIYTSSSK